MTAQMLKAPVEAMPPSAGNVVVGCRFAPPATPGTKPPLITCWTPFTKTLTPAALPDDDATAQFAALVMSLMITASSRPPPKSRGLLVNLSSVRSDEHTSELQSLMRISYAVFRLTKKN